MMNEHEAMVLRAARSKIRVLRDGRAVEISRQEALIEKQQEQGFKGSSYATRAALDQIARANAAEAVKIKADCAAWAEFKAKLEAEFRAARKSGTPMSRILPHPDDILIDPVRGVTLLGPFDEEDWPRFDRKVKLRDALYLQCLLEERSLRLPKDTEPPPSSPLILAMFLNQALPPSLKLSPTSERDYVLKMERLTLRELLTTCRKAWKKAGFDVPRGRHMMSVEVLLPFWKVLSDFARDVTAEDADSASIDRAIHRYIERRSREVPWPAKREATALSAGGKEIPV